MATIRYIKDQEEVVVLPVTHERGVVDSNGVNLETKLGQKQATLVSGTNIKTINNASILGSGNITIDADTSSCEKLDNKVTAISSSSTNTQYPSAKSVYTYVAGMMQNIISLPVFGINSDMHLTISSPDEGILSMFSVNSDGHLIMTT